MSGTPDQLDRVTPVELAHEDVDPIVGPGAGATADDIRLNRKLASAPVDQDAEEDTARPAEVGAFIECGSHRAAGIEDIVHDDHRAVVEVGETGLAHHRPGADGLEIVAVEGDVELPDRHLGPFRLLDEPPEPARQLDAPALDAD